MKVEFHPMTEADIPALISPMTRAFDDDARRFLGQQRGGPDGYDDGSFLRRYGLRDHASSPYTIMVNGSPVGAFIVYWRRHGESVLGNLFLDPSVQDRGIGLETWRYIESQFPSRAWRLETPSWAVRNHYFYEKCGFRRIGQDDRQVIYGKSQ
ncbi:GNAT family N-acetyltransferase [Chitiniphilus eburneus]|uniref:GNAT family N-acetyltransferase n=1 Tax=Chitiniphilus eburneus TaxID=2571148 RepID=A0A4U0Q7X2_9NEIS|nr:GNAT family N-acetyltransferase [Chitiniphilus eburneus]TJZ77347.1 GNAT family N-acetyltransferase [Chitiniphilus eburneus]